MLSASKNPLLDPVFNDGIGISQLVRIDAGVFLINVRKLLPFILIRRAVFKEFPFAAAAA